VNTGTTIYALAHQDKALIDQTMASLKAAPFNKVRMCMFPKDYRYNHNEPDFYAFERNEDGSWNVNRPSLDYWKHMEACLTRLQDMGIQADLILFHPYDRWGFSALSEEERFIYLDYALARLSAFPHVWWSLANEYDLMEITVPEWERIEEFVAAHDPFCHMLSNHNCICHWDFSRQNVTHACIQCKELCRVSEWKREFSKPVLIDECCYEGNLPDEWGCISGREMTNRFWSSCVVGGYCTHGETFLDDENEVLWWAKGGVLHGDSPARIAFLRGIIESLPAQLQAVETFWESMRIVPEQDRQETLAKTGRMKLFVESMWRMNAVDQRSFTSWGQQYEGRIGDDVMLRFYDVRTSARDFLKLNPEKHYRVEVIDTWNMTRDLLGEALPGDAVIALPGREGMAVLAICVNPA